MQYKRLKEDRKTYRRGTPIAAMAVQYFCPSTITYNKKFWLCRNNSGGAHFES
jgi:hypothetical protein